MLVKVHVRSRKNEQEKDLGDLNTKQPVFDGLMTGSEYLQNYSSSVVFPICCGQYLSKCSKEEMGTS